MHYGTSGPTTEKGARHGCPCPETLADPGLGPDADPVASGAGCLVLSGSPRNGRSNGGWQHCPAHRPRPSTTSSSPGAADAEDEKKRPPMRWPFLLADAGSGSQALLDIRLGLTQFARQVVFELLEQLGVQLQLLLPGGLVDAGHCLELLRGKV